MKTSITIIALLLLAFVINHFITFLAISLTTLAIIFMLIGIAFLMGKGKEKKGAIPLIIIALLIFSGVISMPRHNLFTKDAVQYIHASK